MDENRRKLYDQLSQNWNVGSWEEFDRDIDNEDNMRVAWDAVGGQDGYGDFDLFKQSIQRSPQQVEQPQQVVQPPAQQDIQTQVPTDVPKVETPPAVEVTPEEKQDVPPVDVAPNTDVVETPDAVDTNAEVTAAPDATPQPDVAPAVDYTAMTDADAIKSIDSIEDADARRNEALVYSNQRVQKNKSELSSKRSQTVSVPQARAEELGENYAKLFQQVPDGEGNSSSVAQRAISKYYDEYNDNIVKVRSWSDEQLRNAFAEVMQSNAYRSDEERAVAAIPIIEEMNARASNSHAMTMGEREAEDYLSKHPELRANYEKWRNSEEGFNSHKTDEATPFVLSDMVMQEIDSNIKKAAALDERRRPNSMFTDPVTERSFDVARGIDMSQAMNVTDALRNVKRIYGSDNYESYVVAFAARHNMSVEAARQRVDQLVYLTVGERMKELLEPKNSVEYFLRKALYDNYAANIGRALYNMATSKPGDVTVWSLEEQSMQGFEQKNLRSLGGQAVIVGATLTSFANDMLGGGFTPAAIAGGTAGRATARLLGKDAATVFWKRLTTGGASGAFNFAVFDTQCELLRQLRTGDYSGYNLTKSFFGGMEKGTAFGVVGESIGRLFWNSRGWMVPVGEAVKLVGEAATFSTIGYLETGQLTAKDWATNFGMALSGRLHHASEYIADVRSRMKNGRVHKIDANERAALTKKGYGNIADVLHNGKLNKSQLDMLESELETMRNDKSVSWETIRLAEFALNGRLLPAPPMTDFKAERDADDNWVFTPWDKDGDRAIGGSVTVKGTEAKNKLQAELSHQCEKNAFILNEAASGRASVQRAIGKAVISWCDETPGYSASSAYKLYTDAVEKINSGEELGDFEKEVFDGVNKKMKGIEVPDDVADYKKAMRDEGYDLDKILAKPNSQRSSQERAALERYKTWLDGRDADVRNANESDFYAWMERNAIQVGHEDAKAVDEVKDETDEKGESQADETNVRTEEPEVSEDVTETEGELVEAAPETPEAEKPEEPEPPTDDTPTDTPPTGGGEPVVEGEGESGTIDTRSELPIVEAENLAGGKAVDTHDIEQLWPKDFGGLTEEDLPTYLEVAEESRKQAHDYAEGKTDVKPDQQYWEYWAERDKLVEPKAEVEQPPVEQPKQPTEAPVETPVETPVEQEPTAEQPVQPTEQEPSATPTEAAPETTATVEPTPEAKPEVEATEQTNAEEQRRNAEETARKRAQAADPYYMPMENKGGGRMSPDYDKASAEQIFNHLNDRENREQRGTLSADIEKRLKDAQTRLASIEKQEPKGKNRTTSALNAWERRRDAAADRVEKWKEVKRMHDENQRTNGKSDLDDRQAREVFFATDPAEGGSLRDYVMRQLYGMKFKWKGTNYEHSGGRTSGLGGHLGLEDSEKERRGFFGWLDEKNGMTPEEAAHSIWESMPQEWSDRYDTMEILDEVLSVVGDFPRPMDMVRDFAKNHRSMADEQADWDASQMGYKDAAEAEADMEQQERDMASRHDAQAAENAANEETADNLAELQQIANDPNRSEFERQAARSALRWRQLPDAERKRRTPLIERVKKWTRKIGGDGVVVLHSVDEIQDTYTRRMVEQAHANGQRTPGWYDKGKVYIFMPDVTDRRDVDKTMVHEVVSHKGIKGLLGEAAYNDLLDAVYASMSIEAKDEYSHYIGGKENETDVEHHRRMADEWIANNLEGTRVDNMFAEAWNNIAKYVLDTLRGWGFDISNVTKTDLEHLLRQSYKNLRENAELAESGDDVRSESHVRFRVVDDPEEVDRLEREPKVKRYRAMQLIDGKLYPPMSAKVDGEMRQPTEIGVWERSDENPELAKNGKFKLDKGQKDQTPIDVAYNPYFHTSTSGLNDQFSSAWKRPELVVVEVEIPASELTSGYRAEGAKDTVGDIDWHSGPVNTQLPEDRQRTVTLSRWSKVTRIVPDAEVADMIARQMEGTDVSVPFNVVNENLRNELVKRGVKIGEPQKGNAGQASRAAYEEWKNLREQTEASGDGRGSASTYDTTDGGDGARFSQKEDARRDRDHIAEQAMKAKYHMKAPDGTTSRLNEKQWAEVRTNDFKQWAGDWETDALYHIAQRSFSDDNYQATYRFGTTERLNKKLTEILGHPIDGIIIESSRIRHINDHHGSNENLRGQRDITPEDIALLPYLFENYDAVIRNEEFDDKLGNKAVDVIKRVNGLTIIGTIERGKNRMAVATNFELKKSDAAMFQNVPELYVLNDSDVAKVQQEIETRKKNLGNSTKVVGENGEPLVVYRGGEKINIFEKDRASKMAMYGQAFYATPSRYDAEGFAKERTGDSGNVQAVYIDIRNPWVDSTCESMGYPKEASREQAKELIGLLKEKGLVDGDIILAKWEQGRVRSLLGALAEAEYEGRARGRFERWHASDIVQDALKELGYDGVIGRFNSGEGMVDQVAAFEPTQIKSATENNGDFSRENPDIRYRLRDEERDREYADAVAAGDKKKVGKMVLDAVKEAMPNTKAIDRWGKPRLLFHGTPSENKFYQFADGMIFLSSSERNANEYTHYRRVLSTNPVQTGRVMPCFVNMENPLVIEGNRHLWNNIDVEWSDTPVDTRAVGEYAKAHGYDGVIIKKLRDNMYNDDYSYADVYIAFDTRQVKSAGPTYETRKRDHFPWDNYEDLADKIGATYDDNGKLIPLSQRFDTSNSDIRFRTRDDERKPTFYSNAEHAVESVQQGQPLFRVKLDKKAGDKVNVRETDDKKVRVDGLPGKWNDIDEAARAMRFADPEHVYIPSDDGKTLDVVDWTDNQVLTIWRGKPGSKRYEKWRERVLNHIHKQVPEYAKKLGLDVELIDNEADVPAGHENDKSWYDPETGKITIVVPRHGAFDTSDVFASLWHEGVAKEGLRKLVGEENYDNFLDNVYNTSDKDIKGEIERIAAEQYDGDNRAATQEYISRLAEQMGFEHYKDNKLAMADWMERGIKTVRDCFENLCKKLGIWDYVPTLRDDDLRAVLWNAHNKMEAENRNAYTEQKRAERLEEKAAKESADMGAVNIAADNVVDYTEERPSVADARRRLEDPNASEFEKQAARTVLRAYGGDDAPDGGDGGPRFRIKDDTEQLTGEVEYKNRQARQRKEAVADFVKATADLDEMTDSKFATALGKVMRGQREYDKDTVKDITDMAKAMMDAGLLSGLDDFAVKQILTKVKDATGKEGVTKEANKLIDIMLKHQLKKGKSEFEQSLKAKGMKQDSRGVVVQGGLDYHGQRMVKSLKEALGLSDLQAVNDRIVEVEQKLNDPDEVVRGNAADELDGLYIARQYFDEIKQNEINEANVKAEMENAKTRHKNGDMSDAAYHQFVWSCEDALRELRCERVDAWSRLNDQLGDSKSESAERAKVFRDEQNRRKEEIQHWANSDLEGVDADPHAKSLKTRGQRRMDNIKHRLQLLTNPLATFDKLMRFFGEKFPKGEGNLFNFVRKAVDARDSFFKKRKALYDEMDSAVERIGGLHGQKIDSWHDVYTLVKKLPTLTVNVKGKDYPISQGQATYLVAMDAQTDGRMKLRSMGITEADIDRIRGEIDPMLLDLSDWVVHEFLPSMRGELNQTHIRMFGADMSNIENYFPIRTNELARNETVNLAQQNGKIRPATITGSIIERKRNNADLDITTDFFQTTAEHVSEMEHWNSFAELSRDLNTLLSYKNFRAKVNNMSSLRYGDGKQIWDALEKCCAITTGDYIAEVGSGEKIVNAATRKMAQANIALRVYTAAKQLLSSPVYLVQARWDDIIKNIANPMGTWKWAIENLPTFAERWQGRVAGDPILTQSDLESSAAGYKYNKAKEGLARAGYFSNAAVDAMTVAIGGRSIYETKLRQYKDMGYSDEEANKRALQDAAISVNETQQSGIGTFLSPIQQDRTFWSRMVTLYRNASMGFQRELVGGLTAIKHGLSKTWREEAIRKASVKMIREGIDADVAQRVAERMANREAIRGVAWAAMFGSIAPAVWALGSQYFPYKLSGGSDEDEENEGLLHAAVHLFSGWMEGLVFGQTIGSAAEFGLDYARGKKKFRDFGIDMDLFSESFEQIGQKIDSKKAEAIYDLARMFVSMGVGVDPKTIVDPIVGIMDYFGNDYGAARDFGLLFMRLMNVPQSAVDQTYIDELQMTAGEAQKLPAEELARRWATYKRRKGAGPLNALTSDEYDAEIEDKYVERFEKMMDARLDLYDGARLDDAMQTTDPFVKKHLVKKITKDAGGTYRKPRSEKDAAYEQYQSKEGMEGDNELKGRLAQLEDYAAAIRKMGAKLKKTGANKGKWVWTDQKVTDYYNAHKKELDAYAAISEFFTDLGAVKDSILTNPDEGKAWINGVDEQRSKILSETDWVK